MTDYGVWALEWDYDKLAYLHRWQRIKYRIGLNQMCSASVDLAADDSKIASLTTMERLQIYREGSLVFSGVTQKDSWAISEQAPTGDIYAIDADDLACYLQWRVIERAAGLDFDERTGAADDVAKAYVNAHAGAGAAVARQFSDLTVQADAAAVGNVTKLWCGGTLLEHLQRLGAEKEFYWRMVPSASGVQFQTDYALWGLDRTKGNGANDELVLALDRRNVQSIAYTSDRLGHANYFYMGGAGEGRDQLMEERSSAAYVASYHRREMWVPATSYITAAGLQSEGDRCIAEFAPVIAMRAVPTPGTITPSNLGDKITVFERRYGRSFEFDAIIVAINFEITPDGVERVTPELVAA